VPRVCQLCKQVQWSDTAGTAQADLGRHRAVLRQIAIVGSGTDREAGDDERRSSPRASRSWSCASIGPPMRTHDDCQHVMLQIDIEPSTKGLRFSAFPA